MTSRRVMTSRTVGGVLGDGDLAVRDDVTEGRPTAHRLVLLVVTEEGVLAHDAHVDALLLLPQELPAERSANRNVTVHFTLAPFRRGSPLNCKICTRNS